MGFTPKGLPPPIISSLFLFPSCCPMYTTFTIRSQVRSSRQWKKRSRCDSMDIRTARTKCIPISCPIFLFVLIRSYLTVQVARKKNERERYLEKAFGRTQDGSRINGETHRGRSFSLIVSLSHLLLALRRLGFSTKAVASALQVSNNDEALALSILTTLPIQPSARSSVPLSPSFSDELVRLSCPRLLILTD